MVIWWSSGGGLKLLWPPTWGRNRRKTKQERKGEEEKKKKTSVFVLCLVALGWTWFSTLWALCCFAISFRPPLLCWRLTVKTNCVTTAESLLHLATRIKHILCTREIRSRKHILLLLLLIFYLLLTSTAVSFSWNWKVWSMFFFSSNDCTVVWNWTWKHVCILFVHLSVYLLTDKQEGSKREYS